MANPLEAMVRAYAAEHPGDAARALEALKPVDARRVLKGLSRRNVIAVLQQIDPASAAPIFSELGPEATRDLLKEISPRRATAILHKLEDAAREATLTSMDSSTASQLRALLQYLPETAGALMDTRVTALREGQTVAQAVAILRRAQRSTLYYLYVTGDEGRLVGVVSLRELLLAQPRDPIDPLVQRDVVSVPGTMTRTELANLIRERRFVALPVVDGHGSLLGVVRSEAILDTLGQEAFGDLQKMVGAGEDERALSPVSLVVRKRLPWLYVNLGTAFLAAAVVGLFEGTIEKVTALAVLLPVVAGQGGNTGAQALAVVMRGMALHELVPGTVRRLLIKEGLGALLNGIAVAAGTAAAVWLWDGRAALAMVIGLAMVVNMAAAGVAGAATPLVLRGLGKDPAQSSSIVLTTVTDIVGFASFLGFASLFMSRLA
jgi:magnesium transporter